MNQTHSYAVVQGTIEDDWVNFDEQALSISFYAPASFEGANVEAAVI